MPGLSIRFLVFVILGLIILAIFIGFFVFGNDLVTNLVNWFKELIGVA